MAGDVSTTSDNGLAVGIENAVDMEFFGPAFIGGPNITISGTADKIYHELRQSTQFTTHGTFLNTRRKWQFWALLAACAYQVVKRARP